MNPVKVYISYVKHFGYGEYLTKYNVMIGGQPYSSGLVAVLYCGTV
jgi:hypothetical protein